MEGYHSLQRPHHPMCGLQSRELYYMENREWKTKSRSDHRTHQLQPLLTQTLGWEM